VSEQTTQTTTQDPGEGMSTSDLAYGSAQNNQVTRETVPAGTSEAPSLFSTDETQTFRSRWQEIQAAFVDDPQQAVKGADGLVAQTMKRLAEIFADERQKLESQWSSGEDVDTEALRVALQRYRTFFDRLLTV
jgi:hypothetical protein